MKQAREAVAPRPRARAPWLTRPTRRSIFTGRNPGLEATVNGEHLTNLGGIEVTARTGGAYGMALAGGTAAYYGRVSSSGDPGAVCAPRPKLLEWKAAFDSQPQLRMVIAWTPRPKSRILC